MSATKLSMARKDADDNDQVNVLEALRANGGRIRLRASSDEENVSFRITGGTAHTDSNAVVIWFEFNVSEPMLLPVLSDTLPSQTFDNNDGLDIHAARTDEGGYSTTTVKNTTTTNQTNTTTTKNTSRDTTTTYTTNYETQIT